jgi:hypothetical protein
LKTYKGFENPLYVFQFILWVNVKINLKFYYRQQWCIVVKIILAIEVAFCKPERVTFAGSTTPSSYMLPKVFLAAL